MLSDMLAELSFSGGHGYGIGLMSRGSTPEFVFAGRCARDGADISTDTVWEAASLSKPVVALLALERQQDDPELLSRPLRTSAESFGIAHDKRWRELTLRHALTHTTGFPNWRPPAQPLLFEHDPGSIGYSGEGYELLLAELSVGVTASSSSMLEGLLPRLGMTSSSFTAGDGFRSEFAIGHDESGQPFPKQWPVVPKASGTLHATVDDYLRFLATVARPQLLSDLALRAAATSIANRDVEFADGHGRTLGWAFTKTTNGDVLWQHGDNPGFKHIAAVRPATEDAIVVFTNSDVGHALCRALYNRVFEVDGW